MLTEHDTSRNLDPPLYTHSVLANMVRGEDDKWRAISHEKLYASKTLIGALYRSELVRDLGRLGYGIAKTHVDGRFEIAGIPGSRRRWPSGVSAIRGRTSASPSARCS